MNRGCVRAALLVATIVACAAALGRPQDPPARLRIAFIGKSETNPVFIAAHRGAEAAARELGPKHGISIEVRILTPPREDAQVQAERMAQAVRERVSAIAVACSDAMLMRKAIDDAVDQGVPVMTFDSDIAESRRFAHFGVDDAKAGELVLEELARQIGGSGKIAVLAGNLAAPNLKKRAAGVVKSAGKYPGIEVIGPFGHPETPQDAATEVLRVNAANPDLKGWAMVGGWALFRSSQSPVLWTDLQTRKLKVVSIDALPEQLNYVDKGLAVLMAQPVYLWGTSSVEMIVAKVHLKKDVSGTVPLGLVRVSKDNLGTWTRKLRDWGFSPLPPEFLALP